ncbi:MAG: hypothetical protein C0478_08530 [Planctomyces sp.]|nr:hypothetical protein [Planctomyces sp.]
MLGRYTNVEPRRPKGGPDGGRDLQAIYDNTQVVWGAVGFKNSANDSSENKRWVRDKFLSDLESALEKNVDLHGFVFFTNVDLTMGEVDELKTFAAQRGITHTDVFYRERLRQTLDSTEGLAYRLQYLGVSMSLEEQITFLDRIQSARDKELAELKQQQQGIARQIERLEFLNECLRPVQDVGLLIQLNRNCTTTELGHFRAIVEISCGFGPTLQVLHVGGRDFYMDEVDRENCWFGKKTLVWGADSKDIVFSKCDSYPGISDAVGIEFRAPLFRHGQFALVGHFDRTSLDICVTEPLMDQMVAIAFVVNGFVLFEVQRSQIVMSEDVGLTWEVPLEFPELLSNEEAAIRLRRSFIRTADTDNPDLPPPMRNASKEINFQLQTPYKLHLPSLGVGPMPFAAFQMHGVLDLRQDSTPCSAPESVIS